MVVASPTIVAHLIVGAKPEPYLSAVLESITGICDHAVVNDNSAARAANAEVIEQSLLAAAGRLTHLRTAFTGFAAARNACIDATPAQFRGGWALFVDADEVHGDELQPMAKLLDRLPVQIDALDGYSRHFIGSFRWWHALDRRLCFFRLSPDLRWHGAVHERLEPIRQRAILPATWFHYGYVVEPRVEWERGRLYQSLGQTDPAVDDETMAQASPELVWGEKLREAIAFRGQHPRAAWPVIERLSADWHDVFSAVDAIVARQTVLQRLRNAARAANYGRLIAWRRLEAKMRWQWPQNARLTGFP